MTTLHVYDFTRGDKDQKELLSGRGDTISCRRGEG